MEWNDRMGERSRKAWLLLVRGEEVEIFSGKTIPGFVVVRGTDYHQNGKWSYTTYRLEVASGVTPIPGLNGWETGKFTEGLRSSLRTGSIDTWSDLALALGTSVPAAMKFLRKWRPKASAVLDEVDHDLESLDSVGGEKDNETVVVSFGGPSNRQIAAGFWRQCKKIPGHPGEIRLIDPEKGWVKNNIRIARMLGVVLSAVESAGYHGGYVSVTVAVVPGSSIDEPDEEMVVEVPPICPPPPLPAQVISERPASLADLAAKFRKR